MESNSRYLFTLLVALSLAFTTVSAQGDDRVLSALNSLTMKVDSLRERMPQMNILEQAFKMAVLEDRLRDMSTKMEGLQNKMGNIERILQSSSNAVQPTLAPTHQPPNIEKKLEQYGNKIMEAQNTIRNEGREHMAITRTFKGSLEAGVNKIFTKLDAMNKNDREEENGEILTAIDDVKKGITDCSASGVTTRERLDEVLSNLLSEWTTAHKQMREIDVKLSHLKNASSTHQIDPDEIQMVAVRVRTEFQRLEELEPKVLHAVRVSSDLESATNQNEPNENLKLLSRNLSSTLRGLKNTLEDRLTSTREGLEIMDEFFVDPRQAQGRSLTSTWRDGFQDLLSRVNTKIDQKLQAVADQVKAFLSTEALQSLNALRQEMERGREAIRNITPENSWKETMISGLVEVRDALAQGAVEIRKCNEQPAMTASDSLKRDLARLLRNARG